MNKREIFIKIVDSIVFENTNISDYGFTDAEINAAFEFFDEFKNKKNTSKSSGELTENGIKILSYMQENKEAVDNMFTAKTIGEGLFISGRSVAGSMKKMIADGYVEKTGQNPIQYSLTETGINYKIS